MAMIDTYRSNMARKREELAKLSHDKSVESAKIPPLRAKIISANNSISHTKSSSTIKSKLHEIEQAEKSIAAIEKKIADIDKKIATKDKEFITEERHFRNEEEKLNKKRDQDEKKRMQENERQLRTINQSLQHHTYMQHNLSREIAALKSLPEKITVLFFVTVHG